MFNGSRVFVGAFSIAYMIWNGLSIFDIGVIKSIQAILILILDIPLSYLSDRKSRKLSLALSSLFSCLWLLSMGMASDFYSFTIAEIFNALSLIFLKGAYNSLLITEAKKQNVEISHALSVSYKWNYFGMFIFSMIGAFLADMMERNVWNIAALLMLLSLVFCLFEIKDNKIKEERASINKDLISVKRELSKIKTISILFVYSSILFNLLAQYWQPNLAKLEYMSNTELGLAFSGVILCQSIASYSHQKLQKKTIMIISSLLLLLSILFHSLIEENLGTLLFITFTSFFCIKIIMIYAESLFHENITDNLRATCEAFLSTMTQLSLVVLFSLTGYLLQQYGFITLLYLIFTVGFFIAIFEIKKAMYGKA